MTTPRAPHAPGVHVPPPVLFAGGLLAAWALESGVARIHLAVGDGPRGALEGAGALLLVAGLALGAWGILTFRRHRTAILPFRPASTVVRGGPYRFTRNPMYLGLTLAYGGAALLLDSGWMLLLLPLVLVLLVRLVIVREEAYLEASFGGRYRDYRRSVRRWL